MFKRDILFHLERWKDDTHRKPLILRGARQVGKTTVVNEFGKQFDNYLYLNLEKREAASLFELNVSLKDLMPLFFVHCGKVRNEGTILLFIDEIQNVVTQFREIHENMQGTASYVAPFKVAILNCWGSQRRWMSNQVHHAIWHRETYSAEGVLECLSGMPFEVEFISFDDVRNGIPEEIKVIINVGDAYTAFSGAENWIDEKVLTNIRRFVDQGGGFIGVGEPTAYQHQGRYFQLSDVLGVDREMCFSLSTDKYNEKNADHFILEDIDGALDFGEGTSRVYAQGGHYQILAMDGEYSQLVVNEYGRGHSVYFAGLPYSPQNCRLLLRAIYYAAGMEQEMKRYYVTNVDTEVTVFQKTGKIAVINNSAQAQHTELYIKGKCAYVLDLKPGEMRWVDDIEDR